jgi:predicted amidohydrolase
VVVCGLGEVDEESGLFYNTAVVVGPDGYLGKYRKTHFFSADAKWAVEGNLGLPVWDTRLGKVGVEVCMDATYPETGRLLALQGAEVICFSTNWVGSSTPDHRWLSQAFENGVYWIAADRWGRERGMQFMGGSCIAGPDGEVLAVLPSGDGIIYAEIDTDRVANRGYTRPGKERKLADRRPEAYREMLQTPYSWSPTFFHTLYGEPGLPAPQASTVAVVQCSAPLPAVESVVALLRAHSVARAIDLLVLPALALAQSLPAESEGEGLLGVESLCALAAKCSALVVSTVVERAGESSYHTAVLVDANGVVGQQRARHLMHDERTWALPGDDPFLPIDTEAGRIGLATGYDASFFETLRVLATGGADMVCVPARIPWTTERQIEGTDRAWSFWRSKAWESCMIVAYANYGPPSGSGGSGVWRPEVKEERSAEVRAGDSPEAIVSLGVDTASRYIREKRGLGWRRLEWYTPLVLPHKQQFHGVTAPETEGEEPAATA